MRPVYRTFLIVGLLLMLVGFFISLGAFFGGASFSFMRNTIGETYKGRSYDEHNSSGGWNDNTEEEAVNDIIVFEKGSSIKSLDISLSLAEVIIERGGSFEIKTRDIPEREIRTSMSSDGALRISNKDSASLGSIFGTRWINRNPQIIISLPEDLELSNLSIAIGAGRFISKDISIQADKARLEVGAGEMVINNLHSKKLTAECGMGSLTLSGRITGPSVFDCGMGSITAVIQGNKNDYSYSASVGLGNIRVNNEQISGFGSNKSSKKLQNHIDIECGMGDVKITIE